MKKTLNQPIPLPHPNFLSLLGRVFIRRETSKRQIAESIASLASQRCAGFTAGSPVSKKQDY